MRERKLVLTYRLDTLKDKPSRFKKKKQNFKQIWCRNSLGELAPNPLFFVKIENSELKIGEKFTHFEAKVHRVYLILRKRFGFRSSI